MNQHTREKKPRPRTMTNSSGSLTLPTPQPTAFNRRLDEIGIAMGVIALLLAAFASVWAVLAEGDTAVTVALISVVTAVVAVLAYVTREMTNRREKAHDELVKELRRENEENKEELVQAKSECAYWKRKAEERE